MSSINLDALLEFAFARAQELMATQGVFYPLVHGIARNGNHVVIQPDPSIGNSDERGELIQLAFVAYDVIAYAAVSESWMLVLDRGERMTVRPSQSERRAEVICAIVSDGTHRKMRMGEIKRDAQGAYAGLDVQPPELDEGEVGGVLGTLLPLPPTSDFKRRLAREAVRKNKRMKVEVLSPEPQTLVIVSDFYSEKYRNGEEHARKVATDAMKMPFEIFRCIFPLSMLDLVPGNAGFTIENVGPIYAEQGSSEPAFIVAKVVAN